MTSRVENQDAIDAAMFGMLTVPFRFELHSVNERPRNKFLCLIGIFAGSSGNQGGSLPSIQPFG